jgi:hypothetical protein
VKGQGLHNRRRGGVGFDINSFSFLQEVKTLIAAIDTMSK